jgi:hypothetical protein
MEELEKLMVIKDDRNTQIRELQEIAKNPREQANATAPHDQKNQRCNEAVDPL